MIRSCITFVAAAVFAATTLAFLQADQASKAEPTEPSKPQASEPFHAELLTIAKGYKAYGLVDAGRPAGWAPARCRAAPAPVVRASASKDADTHGQKLYFLFARQRDNYLKLSDQPVSVGQIIVKESWTPEEVSAKELQEYLINVVAGTTPAVPMVRKGDKTYRTGRQADLFVMYKVAPATPDTDNGWVYGTVTPDGRTVTSAGRVESCMECHQQAKHDRLFGLPRANTAAEAKSDQK